MAKIPLKKMFEYMYSKIGGDQNEDVKSYLQERPKDITRQSFFDVLVWAVWVAGKSRRAADSFLNRAEQNGFKWDFNFIASWDDKHLLRFANNLHGWVRGSGRPIGRTVPHHAIGRWKAIHKVARQIAIYTSEEDFQKEWFGRKAKSALLDKTDVSYLFNKAIPYVSVANSYFIIRNMGGEAIKADRWIIEFELWYGTTQESVEEELLRIKIPLGLFDIVLWCYCEKFVFRVDKLPEHFALAFDS